MNSNLPPKPPTIPPRPPIAPPASPMSPVDRAFNPIRSVGNYISNVARSVRDVPTAFGTALDSKGAMATGSNGNNNPMAPIKNLATQAGQVVGSVFGKTDNSRSDQYNKEKGYVSGAAKPVSPRKPPVSPRKPPVVGTPMPRDNSGVGKVAPVPMPKKTGTGKVPYTPMGKAAP
jgi:hypothetical protein